MTARFALALAGVPLAFGAGALASHRVLPALGVSARALDQPLLVVTSWGGSGFVAWGLLAATIAAASIPYAIAAGEAERIERSRFAILGVIVASVLASAAAAAFRFVFSSDVYAYAAYGALLAAGGDPYRPHVMSQTLLATPAFADAVRFEWPSLPTCVYGPAFLYLASALVAGTHADLAAVLRGMRALAVVAFAASLALIARSAPDRRPLIAALVGLNPVAIWSVAEGHNDALVLMFAAAGALVARARPMFGGAVIALASVLKAIAVPVALGFAALARRRDACAGALIGLILAAGAQAAAIGAAGGLQVMVATDFVGTRDAALSEGLRGVMALAVLMTTLVLWGGGARLRGLAAGALVVWLLLPHHYAWYGLWLLPLAAVTSRTSEGKALLAATFCGLLRYLPDAAGFAAAVPWTGLLAASIPTAILLVPPMSAAWRSNPGEKAIIR